MAPTKRLRTYGRSNTSLVNNSVEAFNVLFAKNMTKRLLTKKKNKFLVKDLPRRNKCESLLGNDSLQISTDDTFDKLLKHKDQPNEVPTVKISCDISNPEIVDNNTFNKSVRITRQTNHLSSCSSSLLNTNEKTDSVDKTHLRRLLQPSIDKIEESLEIERAQAKPNFSLSYIKVPKESNMSAEISNLGISATDFIKNLQQEVVNHCSTPIVSSKKQKIVNKTVSPIKITTLLKKTFQDINKWDSEFPLENQSDNSKNICFSSFLNGLNSDPQQSSICKNNIQSSYIQDKLNNKSPRRQSFITLRRRKVLKSYQKDSKKFNSAKKNLTVSLESFSNFEIRNLSNHQLSNLKDSLLSHLSLVNLKSKRNMFNQTDWSNCNSYKKINETDESLSTYGAVSHPNINKELVIKVPKLTCDDFENSHSSLVNCEKAARKTISVMENVSRLQTKEDIFEHFYTRNINLMGTNKRAHKECIKNNKIKLNITMAKSAENIFEQFYKRNHKSLQNQQYFNTQEETAKSKDIGVNINNVSTVHSKNGIFSNFSENTSTQEKHCNLNEDKKNESIEYCNDSKVNLGRGHSKDDFENFFKSNLRLTGNEEYFSDIEESKAEHKESKKHTSNLSNIQLEDTFEQYYKTNLDISDLKNSNTNIKEKEYIKDLKVKVTNLLITQPEDTFETFYKSNINISQSNNPCSNQEEKVKKTRELIVNVTNLLITQPEDTFETFYESNINITQSKDFCLNQEKYLEVNSAALQGSQDTSDNVFDTDGEICSSNKRHKKEKDMRETLTNISCSSEDIYKTPAKYCSANYKKYSSEEDDNSTCSEAKSNFIVNVPEKQICVNLVRNDFREFLNIKEYSALITEEEAAKDVMLQTSNTQHFEKFYKDNYGVYNVPTQVKNINTENKSLPIYSDTLCSEHDSNIIESSILESDSLKKIPSTSKSKVNRKTRLRNTAINYKYVEQKTEHTSYISNSNMNSTKKIMHITADSVLDNYQVLEQDTSLENDSITIKQEQNNSTNSKQYVADINPINFQLVGNKLNSDNNGNHLKIIKRSVKTSKKPDFSVSNRNSKTNSNLHSQTDSKDILNISTSDSDCILVEECSNKFVLNDSVREVDHNTLNCNRSPKSIVLKAGKHWRRSLSIYKTSSSFPKEDSSSLLARKTCHNSKLSRLTSQRITNRLSVRFVPLKPVRELQDEYYGTTILEDYALNTSYVPDQILEANLEDTFRCLSLNSKQKRISVKSQLSVPVTAKEIVLRTCSQAEPIPFSQCFPESVLRNCQKIGEGVYGEVFLFKNPNGGTSVLKIVPVEGDQIVNGERQKKFEEVLSEIIITMQLSNLRNNTQNGIAAFTEVQKIQCVQGRYPDKLIDLWDLFDETRGSENDCPDIFGDDQLYIIFQMAYGGKDLESFVFNSAMQAYSMVKQVALALTIAEKELKFEHRDLHWGNVLISTVAANKVASFILDNKTYDIPTMGVEIAIIDYTLSRIEHDGIVIFNDLSLDPDLFTAEGDYQFEVYRLMQQKNRNNWKEFEPFTNILWLDYILEKALVALRYRNTKTKRHKDYMRKLKNLKEDILSYQNVHDFVVANLLDI